MGEGEGLRVIFGLGLVNEFLREEGTEEGWDEVGGLIDLLLIELLSTTKHFLLLE